MPHKILILPDGSTIVEEHDENGDRTGEPQAMSLSEAFMLDHAPSEIAIQSPTIELTTKVEKCLEKYFDQE